MSDFHHSAPYQQLRKRFKAICQRADAKCHLCVRRGDYEMAAIDYAATTGDWMFEIDHVQPLDRFPELAMDMDNNWMPSHRRCNRMKGSKDAEQPGEWVKPDW